MEAVVRLLVLSELLGLLVLPLAGAIFSRISPGAVAALSPAAGLLVWGWIGWWLGAAGLAHDTTAPALAVALVGVLSVPAALRRRSWLWRALSSREHLVAQALLVGACAAMAAVAAHAPAAWGTEKPMDMALLASAGVSESLPPQNPWLAGEPLDGYYVLGHVMAAWAGELAGVAPAVAYNAALALFYGLSVSAAFGVGTAAAAAASRPPLRAGVLTAAAALVLGNLVAAVELAGHTGPLTAYDWFSASRTVQGAINEFPAFSWLVGDLHAHLMAVPFTLVAVAAALQLLLGGVRPLSVAAAGAVAGALWPVNAWSAPVAGALLVAAAWLGAPPARGVAASAGVLAAAFAAAGPFLSTFDAPTDGLAAATGSTAVSELVLAHGLPLALAAPLVVLALTRLVRAGGGSAATGPVARATAFGGLPLTGAALAVWAGGAVFAALACAALACALAALTAREEPVLRLLLLCCAGGSACLAVPEVIVVADAFTGSELARMNTVFKLGHQAWLLLCVAGAGAVWLLLPRVAPAPRRVAAVATGLLVLAGLAFPIAGTWARTSGFAGPARLDGMDWLRAAMPGDAAAVDWLRRHAPADAIVAEAVGNDYSAAGHARISTFSGRATVLGWEGHVVQWGEDPGRRRADVARLYRTRDPTVAQALLTRHEIDFVVVGALERSTYGRAGDSKWSRLGRRVLATGGTELWDVRRPAERSGPAVSRARITAAPAAIRASTPSRSRAPG